ncbi:MAG: hypothetical protein RLZZ301_1838 [Bacteroidota bacterium]|jgi:3-dehydroquinate synthase
MQDASFSSPNVHFEFGPLFQSSFESKLSAYAGSKIAILVDENTHDHCLEFLLTGFPALAEAEVILLPAGEENKVLEVCFQVWETLTDAQFDRQSLLINLGGGMVTDLGGFVASVYKRGIDFIQIPTSLLAMVDAAIGGKTGIDLANYKNQLGTFQHPSGIYIDPGFLTSLPIDEWRNGFAELLKHALVADSDLATQLLKIKDLSLELTPALIARAASIKVQIVEQDPTEKGLRKQLNFGHTIGHALESQALESQTPLAHGHAVAFGILAESFLSVQKGILGTNELQAIEQCVLTQFPLLEVPDRTQLWPYLLQDKKNRHQEIRTCLLAGIGNCLYDQVIDAQDVESALNYLRKLK